MPAAVAAQHDPAPSDHAAPRRASVSWLDAAEARMHDALHRVWDEVLLLTPPSPPRVPALFDDHDDDDDSDSDDNDDDKGYGKRRDMEQVSTHETALHPMAALGNTIARLALGNNHEDDDDDDDESDNMAPLTPPPAPLLTVRQTVWPSAPPPPPAPLPPLSTNGTGHHDEFVPVSLIAPAAAPSGIGSGSGASWTDDDLDEDAVPLIVPAPPPPPHPPLMPLAVPPPLVPIPEEFPPAAGVARSLPASHRISFVDAAPPRRTSIPRMLPPTAPSSTTTMSPSPGSPASPSSPFPVATAPPDVPRPRRPSLALRRASFSKPNPTPLTPATPITSATPTPAAAPASSTVSSTPAVMSPTAVAPPLPHEMAGYFSIFAHLSAPTSTRFDGAHPPVREWAAGMRHALATAYACVPTAHQRHCAHLATQFLLRCVDGLPAARLLQLMAQLPAVAAWDFLAALERDFADPRDTHRAESTLESLALPNQPVGAVLTAVEVWAARAVPRPGPGARAGSVQKSCNAVHAMDPGRACRKSRRVHPPHAVPQPAPRPGARARAAATHEATWLDWPRFCAAARDAERAVVARRGGGVAWGMPPMPPPPPVSVMGGPPSMAEPSGPVPPPAGGVMAAKRTYARARSVSPMVRAQRTVSAVVGSSGGGAGGGERGRWPRRLSLSGSRWSMVGSSSSSGRRASRADPARDGDADGAS
ncbi:hypothetical protein AMAG_14675 [Allomyces macrogynus ATCC 38327]|uniref:Uncharacterized protein n=1 Tax=Allomyces macrogynus (strain ATCC 38327) TaxID=578462 RepID=A0A0L0T6Y3_ALLM3|nr:hypothetical protein AMAG_14675 [Allomyces macrogynus ATCC 38327]|eukprot:KNE70553.1 hypothetical protein AMAG_14675 [Allomyces macrogynus ATCC 38327]